MCNQEISLLLVRGQVIQSFNLDKSYGVYCEGTRRILTAKALKDIYSHVPLSSRRG